MNFIKRNQKGKINILLLIKRIEPIDNTIKRISQGKLNHLHLNLYKNNQVHHYHRKEVNLMKKKN